MHRNLIIKAFEKMKAEQEKENGIPLSTTATAKLLSDFIYENQKFQFGERSLVDCYKSANDESEEEVMIRQPKVVEALCSYLGYDSFKSFKDANEGGTTIKEDFTEESKTLLTIIKENKTLSVITTVIISSIIIVVLLIHFSNNERWMVWQNDRYVEVNFDLEKYNFSQLKLYNEYRVDNLRKVSVDCNTEFFDANGEVKIWYGKNAKKELEYFTSYGLHPETGKTLKPITSYMINKYVCPEI
ncbi:hypothetical protein GCM10007424_11370 [Flavobacterium suaedae]|uniref:Uncharacterized protein n=1 Tax=Flavobacterium suaedae TaxID=1767027 RepID=A0ABQ1JNC6_9FLAO|nr:hypothetical protein [Flavobacterium suaedae]GGB73191.1 hypothetical protein GCM10007424_11370 [Flavobacterium suaedae]